MPWEVGRFKPSQIAAVLGWHLQDAVIAQPIEARPMARPIGSTPAPRRDPSTPKRGPRLREVRKHG